MKRIPSLDGLRAVSIFLVILGHLYRTTGYPLNAVTRFLGDFSHFGVQIFFVISGFLITSLLLNEKSSTGVISLKAFYLRRSFRIFPAAFVYIVFATAMRWLFHHPFPAKFLIFALTYTWCYVHGGPWVLSHLWSLSVEEQFYLLWPVALVFAFGIRKQTCWAVMILAPIARILYQHYSPALGSSAFPAVADNLAAGCLLALYAPQLRRLPAWVYGLPATLAVVLATLVAGYYSERLPGMISGVVPALIAMAMHQLVVRQDRLLNNQVAGYIGRLSYSIYLFQQPFTIQSPATNRWSLFPINLLLAVSLALLSYYLVERPMLGVGHRLNAKLLRSREARTSAASEAISF